MNLQIVVICGMEIATTTVYSSITTTTVTFVCCMFYAYILKLFDTGALLTNVHIQWSNNFLQSSNSIGGKQ